MTKTSATNFGALLRQFRLSAGLSQEELGTRARVSAETIGALERGARRAPYRATVDLLAQGLELSDSELAALETAAARGRGRVRSSTAKPTSPVGNLPSPVTSFIGRDEEIRELRDLLSEHRLVTIVGTGGVGKTRTALEVAAVAAEWFPDGMWFVDLAALDAGSAIEARIVSALGLRLPDAKDRAALAREIVLRSLLLVMDNCEHLLESVASTVAALLKDCPTLKVLATSRERIALTGEVVFQLRNLPLPPAHSQLSASAARAFSAIELFTQRARLAAHRFVLRDDDVPLVTSICQRLDGLALAIEIAAARSPIGLSALDEMIRLHATSVSIGFRDASPRHQTLAATIAWSYGLLNEQEQRVFRELSVFSGSFSLEAAHAVCAWGGVDRSSMSVVLRALCEKSLLNSETDSSEPRFTLLQSIRAYAHRELVDRGEAVHAAARHGEYFAAFAYAQQQRNGMTLDQQVGYVAREIENIDMALERALAPGGDPLVAARITAGLSTYWHHAGRIRESLDNATSLIERLDASAHPALVASLYLVREFGLAGDDRVNALLRAVDLLIEVRNDRLLALAFTRLGQAYRLLKRMSKARSALGWAWTFAVRANAPSFRYALILYERAGVNGIEMQLESARADYNAALAIMNSSDEFLLALQIKSALATVEFRLGNPHVALAIAEEIAAATHSTGDEFPTLCSVCSYRIALGEIAGAKVAARRLVGLARGHHPMFLIVMLENVATIAAVEGRLAAAARLRGFAAELGRRIGYEREPVEEHCYAIGTRALLGQCHDGERQTWMTEGAGLSEQGALEIALTV